MARTTRTARHRPDWSGRIGPGCRRGGPSRPAAPATSRARRASPRRGPCCPRNGAATPLDFLGKLDPRFVARRHFRAPQGHLANASKIPATSPLSSASSPSSVGIFLGGIDLVLRLDHPKSCSSKPMTSEPEPHYRAFRHQPEAEEGPVRRRKDDDVADQEQLPTTKSTPPAAAGTSSTPTAGTKTRSATPSRAPLSRWMPRTRSSTLSSPPRTRSRSATASGAP